jgi:hypothetical protein
MSTGINRSTLREWREHPERSINPRAACPRCTERPALPEPRADCAYLLGRYRGDGCISRAGAKPKEVWRPRIRPGWAGSTCAGSGSNRGSASLCLEILDTSPVDCSTRTAIGELTESGRISRMATAGMSIRDICLPTSPETFSGCAGRLWIGLGAVAISRRNAISVARREAAARLDEFVGPKY